MKIFLKSILLSVVAFTLSLGYAPQVQAQSKKAKTARTQKTTKKTRPVVWGTEFDYLSTRYITMHDFENNDLGPRLMRNSIYARHGRYFKSNDLSRFFFLFDWYQPYRDEVPENELNKYEKANIKFLKKIEKEWYGE